MPTLLIRGPDGTTREHAFEGELTIGRAEGNGLVLTEGGVSRRHATLRVEDGALSIEDLGSANGTLVDQVRIEEPTRLGPTSQVAIGDYVLTIKASAVKASGARSAARPGAASRSLAPARLPSGMKDPGPAPSTRVLGAANKPGAHGAARAAGEPPHSSALAKRPASAIVGPPLEGPALRGLTGPWLNRRFPLSGKVVVGRMPPAQVVVEDDSISRRHAEVEVTAEGVVLRDLGSANGTLLNGVAVTGEILLQPGDVLQVGVVELAFEDGGAELRDVPTRRGSSARTAGTLPLPRRRLLGVAGAVTGLLAVAALVKVAISPKPLTAVPTTTPQAKLDRSAEVQQALTECRSFASTDLGEPDWKRASASCNHALDIDPINEEANRLIRRIDSEKEAEGHYENGQREMARLREDAALDEYGKIPADSFYYLKVKPKVVEAVAAATKRAGDDCKRYARDHFEKEALPRCERYMTFACQDMKPEQLYPPLGYTLDVGNGRIKRHRWRPKDPMYLTFLRVREKITPDAAPWRCPQISILKKAPEPVDNRSLVKAALESRLQETLLSGPLLAYWEGRSNDALVALGKVRDDMRKARLHAQADSLRDDISSVDQLFRTGEGALQSDDPERAADPLREALQLDQKLMGDQYELRPSFYRRNIQQDIAHAAFVAGKHWSDRGDPRRACQIFKLGFSFYRADGDLLRSVAWCSQQGATALSNARNCQDLDWVADVAVEGDGLKEKVAQAKTEHQCR